jgi:hypothetical protein
MSVRKEAPKRVHWLRQIPRLWATLLRGHMLAACWTDHDRLGREEAGGQFLRYRCGSESGHGALIPDRFSLRLIPSPALQARLYVHASDPA